MNQLSIISYFNAVRVNPMVNIRTLPRNVSYTSTSYYNKGIITIRKCLKINSFPNISSKIIYGHLLDIQPPRIQDKCRNYTLGVFCARGEAEGYKTHRGFNFYSILRQQTHFECPK